MISQGIRKILRPDWTNVLLTGNKKTTPVLVVCKKGNIRTLKISKKVAEVLIARGMSVGT